MSKVGSFLARYWKALIAFIAPAAPLFVAAVQESSRAGTHITQAELVFAVATCVVSAAAVYAAPKNKPKPEPKPEGGAADVAFIFYVLGIVFFLVATLNLLGVGTRGLFG